MIPVVQTITYNSHTAHLEPMAGNGCLVMPHHDHNVWLRGSSLHEAEWNHVIRDLDSRGWEPSEGDDGDMCVDGFTDDGRMIVGLYCRDPFIGNPTLPEMVASSEAILFAVRVGTGAAPHRDPLTLAHPVPATRTSTPTA